MAARIRLIALDDADALSELQVNNRSFLAPWEPLREERFFTAAGQRSDIEAALERHRRGDAMPWVVLDDDEAVAGRITLSGIVRGALQSCSLGYWVGEHQTGKGFATDSVRAAVAHAFNELGLHRVQAETLLANTASQRVLRRTGFERYGLAPRYLKIAGIWQDNLMFQRLNDAV